MDHQTMGGTRIRPAWVVAAGLAVLVLVAFGIPLVSLLYVGILLLCPLMMAGMHGGHGQGHDAHAEEPDRLESPDPEALNARDASPSPPEGGRT
jgi:hypothetical protein